MKEYPILEVGSVWVDPHGIKHIVTSSDKDGFTVKPVEEIG